MDQNTYLFASLVSLVLVVVILIAILNIQANTKRTKQYTFMLLKILEKIAKKEGVEIDITELYSQATKKS
jgi:hypothetical protein